MVAVILAAVVLAVGPLPARASGIPTVDVAAIVQLKLQYDQLLQQYDTLRHQYEAVTGHYGRGAGFGEAVTAASVVPGSWQAVVAEQSRGAFGARQAQAEALIRTAPPDSFADPASPAATSYRFGTDAVRSAMAGGDALYAQAQVHLANLSRLGQQVDTTENIKDGQDLQNRIAAESGLLQSALAKLATLNMNLQASVANQVNQATAQRQRYFAPTTK
ncbi:type IV secretion system protein [Cupriavidus respiraculi]|uniref:Type IV secretion system protein VirB5 n=1 Tax=Cupriavidus respiraculi TaxID=195930 RepID=A0ABN7ZIA7_9BURK|nr:type IV secretion system protein [Cupriavidus respiraculi]MBY4949538.1 type IV secretion system protein [Cupriavidus respiraculi]CAG9183991.1 hypothetical protein LMG21510_04996 [Cupriavidus respiraculi]